MSYKIFCRKKAIVLVIDFHTHIFPDTLAPRAVGALERSSNTKSALGGTRRELIDSMAKNHIDFSVNMPIATRPDQAPSINRFAIEEVNGKEGLFSFGAIHPGLEGWRQELRRIKGAGLKGIKLHPDFQGLFLDDPAMVEVMREAAGLGLIILIHCGMDVSFPDLHRSTPERLHRILPQLEGAVLVAAHMGGYQYMDDVERYLVGKDVYIDTSYTIGKFPEEQIRRILTGHRPDRILFGTDSPWEDQGQSLSNLRALDLPQELEEAIEYKNAARLLGLDG